MAIAGQIEQTETALAKSKSVAARAVLRRLAAARKAFLDVVGFIAAGSKTSPNAIFAGSVPYLMLAGNLVAGWQLARSLLVAEDLIEKSRGATSGAGEHLPFLQAKIATAQFYAEHILARTPGLRDSIVDGADSVTAMAVESF